ncbi:MAG: sulfatase-like hydrolase/transferase [Armatimonadota bacterium]
MTRHTNVIFILSDDQGVWAAGCYGNPEIRTPYIDQLAESGMRFNNFFCASPVCSAARASILTGRIPSQHGVHDWIRGGNISADALPAELHGESTEAIEYLGHEQLYTDVMAEGGYLCGFSGKWHCGDSQSPQHGFTHWFAHPQQGVSYYNDALMMLDGKPVQTKGYFSDVITDDALTFITANADRPFYLSLHFTAPHAPWDCHPRDIVESYDNCPFESCPQEPRHPWARTHTQEHLGNRESLKGYFAAVTAMDMNIGRLLLHLEELGLRDNTLIVFTSDNGHSCGHHGFWGKGNGTFPLNMYENSVKVPFIACHPGRIPPGQVRDSLLSAYDIYPTLLDYLDLQIPGTGHRPGRSFVPILQGASGEERDSVIVHSEYGPVRMIRTREWKYVHRYPFGPHELYDMVNDPDERRNAVDDSKNTTLIRELQQELNNWFIEFADPVRDGSRLPVTGRGQLTTVDLEHAPGEAFAILDDLL